MFAAALCLLVVNIIGLPLCMNPGLGYTRFGWPFCYATGALTERQLRQYRAFRMTGEVILSPATPVWGYVRVERFDKSALLGNVAVAAGIMLVTGFLTEYRRRICSAPNAFSLRRLFLVVATVALFAAASQSTLVLSLYMRHAHAWRTFMPIAAILAVVWLLFGRTDKRLVRSKG